MKGRDDRALEVGKAVRRGVFGCRRAGRWRVVLLEMSIEVRLLPEASIAEVAAERLLLVVDVAYVALQIGRDAERPFAVLTLVRLFACMSAQVAGEVGRSREDLQAEPTRVAVLQFGAEQRRVSEGGQDQRVCPSPRRELRCRAFAGEEWAQLRGGREEWIAQRKGRCRRRREF